MRRRFAGGQLLHQRVLSELRRGLKSSSRLAIGYNGRDKMLQFMAITQHDLRAYAPEEVEFMLRGASFRDIQSIALSGMITQGDFVTIAVG